MNNNTIKTSIGSVTGVTILSGGGASGVLFGVEIDGYNRGIKRPNNHHFLKGYFN